MNSRSADPFRIALLAKFHDLENFDCGDPARNAWLQRRAAASQNSDDSRVYVATGDDAVVIGFYALTTGSILRATLPGALRRNAPDPVSCLLLAQLGVTASHQGQGISIKLVLHAMGQAIKVAEIAGCRLFIVHPATPGLVSYYGKFGFTEIEAQPLPVMAMSMAKLRVLMASVV